MYIGEDDLTSAAKDKAVQEVRKNRKIATSYSDDW